jgi:Holliday junction resolvase RusA-like endonuclease
LQAENWYKIIDFDEIKIVSVNQKYMLGRNKSQLVLSPKYRDFKDDLSLNCKQRLITQRLKFKDNAKFKIEIELECYVDIDAPVKCILDSIFRTGIIEANDRDVMELIVKKKKRKKGSLSSIKVFICEI